MDNTVRWDDMTLNAFYLGAWVIDIAHTKGLLKIEKSDPCENGRNHLGSGSHIESIQKLMEW